MRGVQRARGGREEDVRACGGCEGWGRGAEGVQRACRQSRASRAAALAAAALATAASAEAALTCRGDNETTVARRQRRRNPRQRKP